MSGPVCHSCGATIARMCVCLDCAAKAASNPIDMIRSNICTLLGPTLHYVSFDAASIELGKLGWLVFTVGSHRMSDLGLETTDEERKVYWRTHREKLDISGLAFVVDMPTPTAPASMRRIGGDTKGEIGHAESLGVRIEYMSDVWPSRLPSPPKPHDGHGGAGGRGGAGQVEGGRVGD